MVTDESQNPVAPVAPVAPAPKPKPKAKPKAKAAAEKKAAAKAKAAAEKKAAAKAKAAAEKKAAAKAKASRGISIWATQRDRDMYQQLMGDTQEPLSRIVRVLVRNYIRAGHADGLPTLPKKS